MFRGVSICLANVGEKRSSPMREHGYNLSFQRVLASVYISSEEMDVFVYSPCAPFSPPYRTTRHQLGTRKAPPSGDLARAYYINVYLRGNIIPWSRDCRRRIKPVIHLANEQLATWHAFN